MPKSAKTYIEALPRHQRFMIFIDGQVGEDVLRAIMQANLHIWGGRYNPIIPVINNVVSPEWIALAKEFDPDYIYYSKTLDVGVIRGLNLFQPKGYVPFDHEKGRIYFPGLNSHHLLHHNIHEPFNSQSVALLAYTGKWDMPMPAKEFYRLNLGLIAAYYGEDKWMRGYKVLDINEKTVGDIDRLIYENRPYFKSVLSSCHINSIALNASNYWAETRFEWIIYEQGNYLDDLLYFWNRQLYIAPNNRLNQIVSTREEAEQLMEGVNFEPLLYSLAPDHQIYVTSLGMESSAVKALRKKMQEKCRTVRLFSEATPSFPFAPKGGIRRLFSPFIKPTRSVILGEKDFLRVPPLAFENGGAIEDGPYVLDLTLERDTSDEHKEIQFPYGTLLHHLVCQGATRINMSHRISVFLNKDLLQLECKIPSDVRIIKTALSFRDSEAKLINLPVQDLELSDAGQRLSAFVNLFEGDWSIIQQYLDDKFWLLLFRYDSEVKKNSAIKAGRGIFSHMDLKKEIESLFAHYKGKIKERLTKRSEGTLDEEAIAKIKERDINEAFNYYIDPGITDLVKRSGLLVGLRVPCQHCGSKKWYSLAESSDRIKCKGCHQEIMPNLSSGIYFKVSDILINNLLSNQTGNSKQYHGNYVVLKTLLYLKNGYNRPVRSFIWSPPLAYRTRNEGENWTSDLDIVAIVDGELIVGEAKASATEFSPTEIDRLIWVGNHLLPDKIIVAAAEGNLEERVEKIMQGLTNPRCQVIAYKVGKPWYHFGGLFGLGGEEPGQLKSPKDPDGSTVPVTG